MMSNKFIFYLVHLIFLLFLDFIEEDCLCDFDFDLDEIGINLQVDTIVPQIGVNFAVKL